MRVQLRSMHGASGRDVQLRAEIDEGAGTLAGEWVRFELAAGAPGSGRWQAWRVGDEDELRDLDR